MTERFDAGPVLDGLTGFQRDTVAHILGRFYGDPPARRLRAPEVDFRPGRERRGRTAWDFPPGPEACGVFDLWPVRRGVHGVDRDAVADVRVRGRRTRHPPVDHDDSLSAVFG